MIIAVDGPAASGKGTIARRLAAHYGLPHLDTGLLYRAVGIGVLRAGGDPSDAHDALAACRFGDGALNDPQLKSEAAGKAASMVSAHPEVRAALLDRQIAFAAQPGGAILDGRDIGTVIAPEAPAKLFVTASPEARADRRWRELTGSGLAVEYDHVLIDIRARDERDSARSAAPLRQADDARLLDTTALGVEEAVAAAILMVERALHPGGQRWRGMIARFVAALLLLVAAPAPILAAPAPGLVKVLLKTDLGPIILAVDVKHAPITATNFLRYVDTHKFDGKTFYRAARSKTRPGVGLVQGGIDSKISESFFPIKHEPTTVTGLHHHDGTVSMARHDVGSAMGDFFICLGDAPTLDASPGYPGYAAFGQVVSGIAIVRRIMTMPTYPGGLSAETMGQTLVHRVRILSASRLH